jgi:hypothetical protein
MLVGPIVDYFLIITPFIFFFLLFFIPLGFPVCILSPVPFWRRTMRILHIARAHFLLRIVLLLIISWER